jgi:hypothetical protein|tara:strand:+ start:106 stop:216 length:111 start_codon:yes stop_codon:yes gene_type:complete
MYARVKVLALDLPAKQWIISLAFGTFLAFSIKSKAS